MIIKLNNRKMNDDVDAASTGAGGENNVEVDENGNPVAGRSLAEAEAAEENGESGQSEEEEGESEDGSSEEEDTDEDDTEEADDDDDADAEQSDDDDKSKLSTEDQVAAEFDFKSDIVDQTAQLLKAAGLVPADITKQMMASGGQVSPLAIAEVVKKHGETVGGLIVSQLKDFYRASLVQGKLKAQATDRAVFKQVANEFKDMTDQSGSKSWAQVQAWAKKALSNDQRLAINSMLEKGGYQAEVAVKDLCARVRQADGKGDSPAKLQKGGKTVRAKGVTGISKQDYGVAFRKLESKGLVYGESPEFNKLDARRNKGIAQGL